MGFFGSLLDKGFDAVMNVAKEISDTRPTLEGGFQEKFYFDGDKSVMETVISKFGELKELSMFFAFNKVKHKSVGGLLDSWSMRIIEDKKVLLNDSSKRALEYISDGHVYGVRKDSQKEKLDAGDERHISYTDKLIFYIGKAPSDEELEKPDERVFEKTCNYVHNYSYEEEKVDLINKLYYEKIVDFTSAEFSRFFNGIANYDCLVRGSSAILKMKNSGDEKGILKKLEEKIQNNQIDEILENAKKGIDDQSIELNDDKYCVKLGDGSSLEIDRIDCQGFDYFDESVYVKFTNPSGNYIAMLYIEEATLSVRFCAGSGEIENIISFYKEVYAGGKTIKSPIFPENLRDALYFVMNSNDLVERLTDLKIKLMNLYESRNSLKLRNDYLSSNKAEETERLSKLEEKKKKVAEKRSKMNEKKSKENQERQTKQALDDF